MLSALWIAIASVYGLAIGSFLNVVIWRLPRGGSLINPVWSYCPSCEHRLGTPDLVPVFSFLALRARCRYCRQPISWRYPSIELLTGLLFAAVAWRFGGTWDTIFYCLLTAALICVFFIDLEHYIIPDELNIAIALIGFAHNAVGIATRQSGQWTQTGSVSLPASLVGFIGYSAVIYAIGLLGYVYLVSFADKRLSAGRATWDYLRENAQDWAWVTVYYLGTVVPPLRKYAAPPPAMEGATAQEIEENEDAGVMGSGDGKLAAALGANLFLPHSLLSLLIAIFLGASAGIVVLAVRRRRLGSRVPIPFGPAMVGGALLALFFGDSILTWYMGYLHHA